MAFPAAVALSAFAGVRGPEGHVGAVQERGEPV